MAIATTTISTLPLAIAADGNAFVAISRPNGDGTYSTYRLSLASLALLITNGATASLPLGGPLFTTPGPPGFPRWWLNVDTVQYS